MKKKCKQRVVDLFEKLRDSMAVAKSQWDCCLSKQAGLKWADSLLECKCVHPHSRYTRLAVINTLPPCRVCSQLQWEPGQDFLDCWIKKKSRHPLRFLFHI